MGIREEGYWLRQADAIKRQLMGTIAYGVRVGMAESSDYKNAIKELELGTPEEKGKEELSPLWNMLFFIKGSKAQGGSRV